MPQPVEFPALVEENLLRLESGCWIWRGPATDTGYPMIHFKGEKFSARRFVYDLAIRKPKGSLLTSCGRVDCLRPEHLYQT